MARATKGFMPDEEGMALYAAAKKAARSGLGPILEIGTYCAKSALYLGAGAAEVRGAGGQARTVVFSVDHHRGSEELQPGWAHHDPEVVDPATGVMDTLPWARRAVAEAGLEGTVVLVVGESTAVARAWSTPLSLLFIDGGHGDTVAWADYRSWAPKLAPAGALAVHDVFADPAEGGQVPFNIYRHALGSGAFAEEAAIGSLRVMRRLAGAWEGPDHERP